MKILLLGGGGREHAIALALSKSKKIIKENLFVSPGNPGIFEIATEAKININNQNEIVDFCQNNHIELVVVGPEQPLADGIADLLKHNEIPCFGPQKFAAQLESSKGFAKDFMAKYEIPTANYKRFNLEEKTLAHNYIDELGLPLVIKADGLAGGKGVVIPESFAEAHHDLDEMFAGQFGETNTSVVIEEFMQGEEASIFAICDGSDFITLPASQDHKRVGNGDTGKNTGGMGAYAPAKVVTEEVLQHVHNDIIASVLEGMNLEGTPFVGCLYVGLMIKDGVSRVVEFNVRFGDPETEVVLPLVEGDFAKLLYTSALGKINKNAISIKENTSACSVILASNGYPAHFEKGFEIKGLESANSENQIIFHCGTKSENNTIVSNGGRVLAVTAIENNLQNAIDSAYQLVNKVSFENMYYRKDIGKKGV
ncbi:MAG: phosphoribosylamine--glycine ligase [Candidatus Kapabacteria bacterium]|nr:phosphoribosylamine--glycine ligase [Candidatus Kapabacteria bacterium]